ncbi:MAG: thioredoxin family protein [Candidatus Eisenbacteria bacterium]
MILRAGLVAVCVAGLPLLAPRSGAPQAADPSGESPWIENFELIVRLADATAASDGKAPGLAQTGGAQAAGQSTGASAVQEEAAGEPVGEVFDSSDYQSMLLLPPIGDQAYILDLASLKARAYPRSAVVTADGSVRMPSADQGREAGVASTDEEGRIRLAHLGKSILVEPAPPLVGTLSRSELEARQPVYARHAHSYHPDPGMVTILAANRHPVEILAFFGSWCRTCKNLLPALIATLDAADNPAFHLVLIGLDENMQEPAELIATHGLSATPSFIFLTDGYELGRIEDQPRKTIEADFVEILLELDGGGQ